MVEAMEIPKGFKKTEVGIIPADWEVKTLGDVGEVKMCRRVFNHETQSEGTIPFYKIGTFGKEADAYISEKHYNNYRQRFSFPKKGDILISAAGTIGRTLIYDGKPAYFQDSNIVWIDNKENLISNNFLYHVFQVVKYNTEGGTIQRLYNNILRSTKFICPPTKAEQTAIAEALNDTDALITELEKLIAKKKAIKQGAMQELLKPKEGWEVNKLGEICQILKGKGLSKSQLDEYGNSDCLLYGELFTTYKEVIAEVVSRTNSKEGLDSKYGDILFPGSTTTIGIDLAKASSILIGNVKLGGDIIILRKKDYEYNSEFAAYFLNIIKRNEIAQNAKGVTIYHLHGKDLVDIEIFFPSIEIQTRIAQILSDMDKEIESLEKKLDKYKMLKQGMMQNLLTGKIRLI